MLTRKLCNDDRNRLRLCVEPVSARGADDAGAPARRHEPGAYTPTTMSFFAALGGLSLLLACGFALRLAVPLLDDSCCPCHSSAASSASRRVRSASTSCRLP